MEGTVTSSIPARGEQRLQWLLTVAFFVGMFLCRPFRLGSDYAVVGSLVLLAVGSVAAATKHQKVVLMNGVALAFAFGAFWVWLAIHATVVGSAGAVFVAQAAALNTAAAFGCAFFFASPQRSAKFFRLILWFFALCGASAAVTSLLHFSLDIPWRALRIGNVPVSDAFYSQHGDVLFPFSVTYNYAFYSGVEQPRFAFMLRESGIAQAVIGWVAIAAAFYYRHKVPKKIVLLLGIALVATLSTALAVTGLLVAATYIFYMRMHPIIKLVLLGAFSVSAVWAGLAWANDETFGVAAKVNTSSYIDRAMAVQLSLEEFYSNIMGNGLYSAQGTNAAVTFLGQLQEIGIIGAVGAGLLLLFAHLVRKKVGGTLIPYMPIVVTALTTQPLIDVPGFLPLIFVLLVPERVEAVTGSYFGPPPTRRKRLPRNTGVVRQTPLSARGPTKRIE